MKILHLMLACFYIDDYAYQENLLPKYHKLAGHEVEIIASPFNFDKKGNISPYKKEAKYQNSDGIPVTRLMYKKGPIAKKLRYFVGLRAELERVNPDVIFVHGVQFMDAKILCKYVEKHPKVRVFADSHTDFVNSAHGFLSRRVLHGIFWKHSARQLSRICEKMFGVTASRCEFLELIYGIPREQIALLIMGLDDKAVDFEKAPEIRREIREKYQIAEDDFLIVTGGKIDRLKNTVELMLAVKNLNSPKVKLLIFGVPNDEVKPEFEKLLSENIISAGWQTPDGINKILLAADLAVYPGTHSVVWEQTVGCGVPAIFREWGGMTHVDAGGNCIFVQDGSVPEVQQVIGNLLHTPDIYANLKEQAQKAKSKFHYSEIAKLSIGNFYHE